MAKSSFLSISVRSTISRRPPGHRPVTTRSPPRPRPASRNCKPPWPSWKQPPPVTGRISNASASVPTGSWRSYCGRRPTPWQPRKWRPDSTVNWRPCGRGLGGVGSRADWVGSLDSRAGAPSAHRAGLLLEVSSATRRLLWRGSTASRQTGRERKGWDSNPRGSVNPLAVFKTAALNHSATLPYQQDQSVSNNWTANAL